jgi:YVTN family beta-propeller protein
MLEFRLLGTLEATGNDGRPLSIGRGKERALLAYMLLHRNAAVPREALIDALWADDPPASAAHALDVYVSRLRKGLGVAGVLETQSGALRLNVADEKLDVARFERLLSEARSARDPAARLALVEQALALWRGHALVDVLDEPFARPESERLEEERLVAGEERLDALLVLGRHDEAVGRLQALVTAQPLRERPLRLLMLALYRAGRQAEALALFSDARKTLRDELGLEPSAELRELQAAILRQDETLAAPPRQEPAPLARPLLVRVKSSGGRRRRALLILCLGLAVAGGIAAATLLATRGSPHLSQIDFNGVGAIDAGSGRIIDEVIPSASPGRLAVEGNVVWTANEADDTVSRIDLSTASVVRTIPVGSSPSGIAVGGAAVWVANTLDGTVSRIDPATNTRIGTTHVGHAPTAVAIGLGAVWVTNAGDRTVTKIDPTTGHALKTFPSGADGQGLAVGAGSLWVVDQSGDALVRIDARTEQIVHTIPVGTGPVAAIYAFGRVWVANSFDGTISRVDPRTNVVTGTTDVGGAPVGVAAAGGRVWTADSSTQRVFAIDPATNLVARRINVGSPPVAIAAGKNAVWMSVQPAPGTHRGGTLRITSPSGYLDSIDPAVADTPESWSMVIMTNDGLVTFRRAGGSDGTQIVPDLAESIPEPQNGGTTYTFELKRGIRYSTGRAVLPADFRSALERLFKLQSPGTGFYEGLVGAAACTASPRHCDLSRGVITDAASHTVSFHLTAPDPEFLDKLALPFADAVPAAISSGHAGALPVATGPYEVTDYRPHRSVTLARNPYFKLWNAAAQPAGFPDRIVWHAAVPIGAATDAVLGGRADLMFPNPPPGRLGEIRTQYASQVHSHPVAKVAYVFMNTHVPPFSDVRVRRALNYALDRAEIVRLQGGRQSAEPTCQILPPLLSDHRPYCPYTRNPNKSGAWTAPDLAKARRLIAASGTHGMPVVVWSLDREPFKSEMRYVTRVLGLLGYHASMRFPGNDVYFGKVGDSRSRAQVGFIGWSADYADPSDFIDNQFRCGAFLAGSPNNVNLSEFCNAATDVLIARAEALQVADPQAADRLWARSDRQIVDRALYAPLFVPRAIDFVSRRVGNYEFSPQWGVLIDQLWVR